MTEPPPESRRRPGHAGTGTATVFLAGGPGLSVAYASRVLAARDFAAGWLFPEQPGCGDGQASAEPVTAEGTVAAMAGLIAAQGRPVTLVAHSWGAYLAVELLARMPAALDRLVLLHPVPPTRAGFDEAAGILLGRAGPEVLARAGPLLARDDPEAGRAVMEALLPAYHGRGAAPPDLALDLSLPTYRSVLASLDAYDHRSVVAQNRARVTLAFGGTDYITPDLYARHLGAELGGFACATLRGGHFAFLEDPRLRALLRGRGS